VLHKLLSKSRVHKFYKVLKPPQISRRQKVTRDFHIKGPKALGDEWRYIYGSNTVTIWLAQKCWRHSWSLDPSRDDRNVFCSCHVACNHNLICHLWRALVEHCRRQPQHLNQLVAVSARCVGASEFTAHLSSTVPHPLAFSHLHLSLE
jgi:hypothetical protein